MPDIMRRFRFPIEAGHVLAYARAIGETSPEFLSPDYVDLASAGGIVPPPTFLVAADQFDPESPRRPGVGEVWPGSGRVQAGWQRPPGRGRGFHAEQRYEFCRHPRIGEVLSVEVSEGRKWQKGGRQGDLHFEETVSRYIDGDGIEIASARWTKVSIQPIGQPGTEDANSSTRLTPATPGVHSVVGRSPERITREQFVRQGDHWTQVVVEDLTLSQLVRYAGASGDYIGVHHDPDLARLAGYERVIAHGMLTMALSARVVSSLVGTAAIRSLSSRMRGVVHVGDTLITTVTADEVRAEGQPLGIFRLATTNSAGETVLDGRAEATLPE
jgi:acyl dehydratase